MLTVLDYALQFDGSQNYVNVPGISLYNVTNSWTIVCVVKCLFTTATSGTFFGIGNNVSPAGRIIFKLSGGADGKTRYNITWSDNSTTNITGSIVMADNSTHELILSYNGTNVYTFVDGAQNSSDAAIGKQMSLSTSNTINIGKGSDTQANLNGTIDRVAFYNTATTNGVKPTSGLIGQWNLNEGSGILTRDTSGNGNDGTLTGSPVPKWVNPLIANPSSAQIFDTVF